jgi:RNA polymerase sigma factor (sigma-70 family)
MEAAVRCPCPMRRSDDDLHKVPESEFHSLSQDELLRLVVICRDSTDRSKRKRARKAWETLIATDIDRVRGIVATFRFPDRADVYVHPEQRDDAVQYAFERLAKMFVSFEGTEFRSYRAAMRRCVNFACMDHCRREMAHEKRIAGSLDDEITDREGDKRGRYDQEIARREQERIDADGELQRAHELDERVREAIKKLAGDRRVALEMTRDGCSTNEIAERLDTSHANVYKLRERGLKDLRDILDGDGTP